MKSNASRFDMYIISTGLGAVATGIYSIFMVTIVRLVNIKGLKFG